MSWGSFLNMVMGGADVKPIVYLFKSQVFQLAEYLEVPEKIFVKEFLLQIHTVQSKHRRNFSLVSICNT
jgi:NAD+ synthase